MSKLLCVVSVLVVLAVLTSEHRLAVAAATQIGNDFLSQDLIRGPGSSGLMLNHDHDELSSVSAAVPGFNTDDDTDVVVDEEAFSIDEYAEEEEEEVLLVGVEECTPDPGRSADEEEIVEGDDDLLLSVVQEADSNDSEEHGSSGGDVQCPECGKHFRSDKSMFGHLRSHPDRGYKGATPPPAKRKLLPSRHPALSSPPAVHRDRLVARYSQRDPTLNTLEIQAAYGMLTLKHSGNRIAQDESVNVKREPDVPAEEGLPSSKSGNNVRIGDQNGGSVAKMDGYDDTVICSEGGTSAAKMAGDDHPAIHGGSTLGLEVPAKRGKTKKSKDAHGKEKDVPCAAGKASRPYICKHCQAVFPTHQALGGHMAAHNKEWRVQAQNEQAAWEAHHQGKAGQSRLNKPAGGEEAEPQRGGMSAAARELLMERYTRLFNQGLQTRQEETAGYKKQRTGREDGGAVPVAPPVADGDRRMLFGIDLNARAPGPE